jgi:hypothetical protein
MRLREAARCLCDFEISVGRIISQPSRLEVAFVEVADCESLCSPAGSFVSS